MTNIIIRHPPETELDRLVCELMRSYLERMVTQIPDEMRRQRRAISWLEHETGIQRDTLKRRLKLFELYHMVNPSVHR